MKSLPARATPADYQAHAQAGALTVAAEFKGHSIPAPEGTLTTEDYVVVETGLYGAPGARLTLSPNDFSLRINKKKDVLAAQPYGLVIASVKDPEWEPPKPAGKSKTSLGSGGKEPDEGPPRPVKIPIEVQRAMAQKVKKASLAEGDRVLPQGGLLFFQYRGRAQGIRSVELIYSGPAGKLELPLQP